MEIKRMRRKFSLAFKAQVAIAALQEKETLSALSHKFTVHPSQIVKWKKEFIANSAAAFESKKDAQKAERQRESMLKKIGELQLDKDYLKKNLSKLGHATNEGV